jgi:hypothetical protein
LLHLPMISMEDACRQRSLSAVFGAFRVADFVPTDEFTQHSLEIQIRMPLCNACLRFDAWAIVSSRFGSLSIPLSRICTGAADGCDFCTILLNKVQPDAGWGYEWVRMALFSNGKRIQNDRNSELVDGATSLVLDEAQSPMTDPEHETMDSNSNTISIVADEGTSRAKMTRKMMLI